MGEDSKPSVDLLGDPWTPPRDPRGRKRHKRNPQVAERVAVLKASGATVEEIALRFGLSEPTLRKYYFRELEDGAALARQLITEAMYDKALAGNAAAARFIREEFDKVIVAHPVRRAPKADKLGKKDAANLEAKTAHEETEWASLLN